MGFRSQIEPSAAWLESIQNDDDGFGIVPGRRWRSPLGFHPIRTDRSGGDFISRVDHDVAEMP